MANNHEVLKSNLSRLMKERSLRIVDLEAKAKKGRIVNNILSGNSTNPSIYTIKSIADALNIDMEDLLVEGKEEEVLNSSLYIDTCIKVVNELTPLITKHNIKISNASNLVKEAYNYGYDLNLTQADEQFIKWLVKQKYNNKT